VFFGLICDKFEFSIADISVKIQFLILAVAAAMCFLSMPVLAQKTGASSPPAVVQPGAPGQPSRKLPPSTRAQLTPLSAKDIDFMKGMIMHHAQAVEMTAMIDSHTENKNLRLLGSRISKSQSDEIQFMKRWLEARGEQIPQPSAAMMMNMSGMGATGQPRPTLMPGMLTADQMLALRSAKGAEFDQLFLKGMIQHHTGALVMVKDMFGTAGAGQDAELFNFATDVDSGQRAEIRIMENLLGEKP